MARTRKSKVGTTQDAGGTRNAGTTRVDARAGDRGVGVAGDFHARDVNTGVVLNIFMEARTGASYEDLLRLAGQVGITGKNLGKLYRDSLPSQATAIPSTDMRAILTDLCERPLQSNNRLPLFDFVGKLARLDEAAAVRDRLEGWLRQAEANFGADAAPTAAAGKQPATPPREPPQAVLEVQLTPDTDNPNRQKGKRYLVEVALWKSDTGYLPTFHSPLGKDPQPLDKIPEVVADVLEHSGSLKQVESLHNLAFEFILPFELLSHAVDRWKPKEGPVPVGAYGAIHPLVVRSLDRMEFYATNAYAGTLLHGTWKGKWHAFRGTLAKQTWEALRWRQLDGRADQQNLIKELQADQEACCLGLTHPPDEHALSALVWAGVPVALWAREADATAPGALCLKDLLTMTLQGKALAHLPSSIKAARCGDAGHMYPHNCLALMWDDPTRLPLRYRPEGVFRDEQLESVQGHR
jgi:hypothetical protein